MRKIINAATGEVLGEDTVPAVALWYERHRSEWRAPLTDDEVMPALRAVWRAAVAYMGDPLYVVRVTQGA